MLLSINENFMHCLSLKETPKAVWETLRNMQMNKSHAGQFTLRLKLFKLKKTSSQTIGDIVQEISGIENYLAFCRHARKEDDKLFALYQGIGDEHEIIRIMLQNSTDVNFEDAISKLEVRENEKKCNKTSTRPSSTFISSAR